MREIYIVLHTSILAFICHPFIILEAPHTNADCIASLFLLLISCFYLDFCCDSDDYSSDSGTASDATMPNEREIIEFDVVTASSDDDGDYLYLEDSSGGSDVNNTKH